MLLLQTLAAKANRGLIPALSSTPPRSNRTQSKYHLTPVGHNLSETVGRSEGADEADRDG